MRSLAGFLSGERSDPHEGRTSPTSRAWEVNQRLRNNNRWLVTSSSSFPWPMHVGRWSTLMCSLYVSNINYAPAAPVFDVIEPNSLRPSSTSRPVHMHYVVGRQVFQLFSKCVQTIAMSFFLLSPVEVHVHLFRSLFVFGLRHSGFSASM